MKLRFLLLALATLGLFAWRGSAQNESQPGLTLKDQEDKNSYSIGVNMGNGLKHQSEQQELNIKPEIVSAGLRDALTSGKMLLTDQEVRETLMALQRDLMAKIGAKNKKQGDAFLADNKKKAGVKTLPDGLQYQILIEGKGPKPKATDKVKVNYKGTLIDGTEFDSSSKQGGPITLPLSGVIAGWAEGIQLMTVGSRWRLYIPSNLAYEEKGAPGTVIGPGSTLIFEVELVGIEPGPKS